jgi:DNA-binding CsgD family transcriptional regulator
MRLSREQSDRILRDLQSSPRHFGYSATQWTGPCLSRHLATHYNLHSDARQCRRLIARVKLPVASSNVQAPKQVIQKIRPWSGFSETYRQEKALQRIRQISVANLPAKAFAAALIEQLTLATNSGDAAQCLIFSDRGEPRYMFPDVSVAEWTVSHIAEIERANGDDPAVSGMLISSRQLALAPEPMLAPAQFMSPRFHESPAYDEMWRHHKVYSGAMSVLRCHGQFIGCSPVWKSRAEKPFTQNDLEFLRKAQPLIIHGMQVCRASVQTSLAQDQTELVSPDIGVITADFKGRVIAMDERAKALFFQPALFDGRTLDAFSSTNLRSGLQYVSDIVRQTFSKPGSGLDVPAARVWWHGTGCVLLLRAVLSHRLAGSPLVTVLVEEHEPASTKQRRLAVKYGLSPRESQIFQLSQAGTSRKEIAGQLALSDNTVKTYLKQIAVKIGDAGNRPQ